MLHLSVTRVRNCMTTDLVTWMTGPPSLEHDPTVRVIVVRHRGTRVLEVSVVFVITHPTRPRCCGVETVIVPILPGGYGGNTQSITSLNAYGNY